MLNRYRFFVLAIVSAIVIFLGYRIVVVSMYPEKGAVVSGLPHTGVAGSEEDPASQAARAEFEDLVRRGKAPKDQYGRSMLFPDTVFEDTATSKGVDVAPILAAARAKIDAWRPGGYDEFRKYWRAVGREGDPWWPAIDETVAGSNGSPTIAEQYDDSVKGLAGVRVLWEKAQVTMEQMPGESERWRFYMHSTAAMTWQDKRDAGIPWGQIDGKTMYMWERYSKIDFRSPDSELAFLMVPFEFQDDRRNRLDGKPPIFLMRLSRSKATGNEWVVFETSVLVAREIFKESFYRLPR